jgi:hypothetical protein
MPRKLNTLLPLVSDLGAWFHHEVIRSLYCGTQNAFFGHLAIFTARNMWECSRCTRPPYLAIVADMLNTYKTLVAASNNEIW